MPQRKEYLRSYYERNKEHLKARAQARYRANRAAVLARSKQWRAANPESQKARHKAYRLQNRNTIRTAELAGTGFSVELFDALIAAQDGRCSICQVEFDQSSPRNKACADHCHTSGKPRGVICCACNLGLGHFKDDPERLRAAIVYLTRFA